MPLRNITTLFSEFVKSEKVGSIVLLIMTIISLILSNSPLESSYIAFWNTHVLGHSLIDWINDGLMAIFFLMIGLELEREIYVGELSRIKKASLPAFAAIGGMLIPALLFLFFNFGTEYQSGAGIPMATDIAFAIGILSLLGSGVPLNLKVFLTALAVIDDLGSIIIIAVFYTGTISFSYLLLALTTYGVLILFNRLRFYNIFLYLAGGVIMWYFLLNSGVHGTLAGVLLAFAIPFGRGDTGSPSFVLQHHLHIPVALIILPLFALANTAIRIEGGFLNNLTQNYSLGIIIGLLFGKPAGIFLFSCLAVISGISEKPSDLKWTYIFGAGLLGGIGFTMSIFISLLSFTDPEIINNSKVSILIGSLLAGLIGFIWLRSTLRR